MAGHADNVQCGNQSESGEWTNVERELLLREFGGRAGTMRLTVVKEVQPQTKSYHLTKVYEKTLQESG